MLQSKELELQSPIKINRWIDIRSVEAKEICQSPAFTKMILKILESNDTRPFIVDDLGRIYGKGDCNFYPLHDTFCGETIGYRIVKKAFN